MNSIQPYTSNRLNVLALDGDVMLFWAHLQQDNVSNIALRIEEDRYDCWADIFWVADEPYIIGLLPSAPFIEGKDISILLLNEDTPIAARRGTYNTQSATYQQQQLFSNMKEEERSDFFAWMIGLPAETGFTDSEGFRNFCIELKALSFPLSFHVTHSYWLNPYFLYFEGETQEARPYGEPQIEFLCREFFAKAYSHFLQLSETSFAFIAIFDDKRVSQNPFGSEFLYLTQDHSVAMQSMNPVWAQGMEFIHFLNGKPTFHKHGIQELISNTLLEHSPDTMLAEAANIVEKLQSYLEFTPTFCNNAQDPFNIHFETVIPLGSDGIFTCGWMRDPYHMLESVEAHTAAGYHFNLGEHFFRTKRPDVTQAFLNTPHGGFQEDAGFIAYTPLPDDISYKLQTHGISLRNLHFKVKLRGGVEYEIQPEMRFRDARTSRDTVLKLVSGSDVSESMLMECLGPAASILQSEAMKEVGVKDVYEIGKQVSNPRVTLSIPLYKRLDFLKIQFATFANDLAMKECEIVYVLDSPWQEAEVRDFLREYSHLYQLPVKLMVMKHNSGYAAASNTGTLQARGEYIILLNSDVFPSKKGWSHQMADFYDSKKGMIGALAPKLIYEDDSLQHAGMFFKKTTFPDWINLHYYKGYPRDYTPASVNRPVPAVTGACLMMARDLWEDIDRLSVDYVVGDFEDSDLCLKCAERGLENWYFADTELYHLERQSVPLNDSYTESLAWRFNARQHSTRWDGLIATLMKKYGEV